MPEEGNGQDPKGNSGQAPQTTPPPAAGGEIPGQAPPGARTTAEIERDLANVRSEAAARRVENQQLKDKLKVLEDAQLSEQEKLKKDALDATARATATETELKAVRVQSEVERQARALGIVDEEAAYDLLKKDAIIYDGDKPTNIVELLTDLAKRKPYLVGAGGGAVGNPGRENSGGGGLTFEQVKLMSQAEIAARRDEVMKVLSAKK